MSMYANALLPKQIAEIGKIYVLIGTDRGLYARANTMLEDYFQRLGRHNDFNQNRHNRLFKNGTMPRDPSLAPILYDFLDLEFHLVLRNYASSHELCTTIKDRIVKLRTQVRNRINSLDNPFAVLARDIDPDDIDRKVPDVFINKFIGFRRSSRGEIVRFYLQIQRGNNRERAIIRFRNLYRRGQHKWYIRGAGIYAKNNTLYLFGHARDQRSESTGYRILALRQLDTSDMITGPLITMDESEPITARTVLIPWEKLNFTDEQKRMKEAELRDHLITTQRLETHSDDYVKFIDEVRGHVKDCFPLTQDQGLFHYISNMTTDVLHCVPPHDDPLIREELRLREIAHNSRQRIKPEVVKAMRTYTDGLNRM